MTAISRTKPALPPTQPLARESLAEGQSIRFMARAWGARIPERQRQQAAWAFIKTAVDEYLTLTSSKAGTPICVSPPAIALTFQLDRSAIELARALGRQSAELPIEQACFQLSATYTALVPSGMRGELGMYYTPPALTNRLLDLAEEAGIDWRNARVLDPACGGGAFLLPVALRMRKAIEHLPRAQQLDNITRRLCGFEIDPFAAWLTETWLEIAFADLLPGKRLGSVVQVRNTLDEEPSDTFFDLVVGNPPYGRVTLTRDQRERFRRSLYGHANLYGVFTDIALRWTKPDGLIAYVSPTSFLAGEYFKNLRALLAIEAPPAAVDFISARRGVFEDVLQEALLATYRKGGMANGTPVHFLNVMSDVSAGITHAGRFVVPKDAFRPWLAPRQPNHQALVDRLLLMPTRLSDWGYQVSTGPLVWNRFKSQLRSRSGKDTFPLVWAEAVAGPNRFIHRADKRNHQPYFHAKPRDAWLKINVPCVLVQRTTAKEQPRRLIAAEMPQRFIQKHGAVIVENHLNMIRPIAGQKPKVSTAAVAALINSAIADEAFRCISGSVAVSAFELEALPLPSVKDMARVEKLVRDKASPERIETLLQSLYFGKA